MRYRVSHRTIYNYAEPVTLCHSLAHLQPRQTTRQLCLARRILVEPTPQVESERVDFYGNPVYAFTLQKPHRRLVVTAVSRVQVQPAPEPGSALFSRSWEEVRDFIAADRTKSGLEALQFTFDSPLVRTNAALLQYAQPSFTPGRAFLEAVRDLTSRIHQDYVYDPQATQVSTPLEEVMKMRRGVCQDFAHLQIGCLRSVGLPARYVSGYLLTQPPPGVERLVGADASHAWVSVYKPDLGWIDFDPTNDLLPGDRHITLGWGRDFGEISPLRGMVLGGGAHSLSVAVDVVPEE